MADSLFEKLGGESGLRAIINTFIDRVFEDRMIGFFFRKCRPSAYQGNGVSAGGQFSRRRY